MSKIRKFVLTILVAIFIFLSIPNIKADESSPDSSFREVIIFDQGLEYKIESKGETIGEILINAKIQIQNNDIIFPSLTHRIDENQSPIKIIIDRAAPVSLNVYSKTKTIFTQQEKVGEFLKETRTELKSGDLINYNLDDEIFPGIEIKIWGKPKLKPKPAPKSVKIMKTGQVQMGVASWYSYIPGNFAASTTYKKGTKLLVTNLANSKKVLVTVNDYGPFNGPVIDLERNAFLKLAPLWKGVIRVKVEKVVIN